jgi:hypothetical protein
MKHILLILLVLFLIEESCNYSSSSQQATSQQETNDSLVMKKKAENRLAERNTLLESLNYWVAQGGDTGESNARFDELKAQLVEKGIKVKWVSTHYVLDED